MRSDFGRVFLPEMSISASYLTCEEFNFHRPKTFMLQSEEMVFPWHIPYCRSCPCIHGGVPGQLWWSPLLWLVSNPHTCIGSGCISFGNYTGLMAALVIYSPNATTTRFIRENNLVPVIQSILLEEFQVLLRTHCILLYSTGSPVEYSRNPYVLTSCI